MELQNDWVGFLCCSSQASATSFTSNLILLGVVELQLFQLQMTYQEQFPTTAYMRHSCAFHKTQLFKDDIRQTNWARTAQSFLCTDFCNVSACVRQNKGIITNLQMPITTTNFLQLKNDCITFQQMWWSTPYSTCWGQTIISNQPIQATSFVCRLQQHFSGDNVDIQILQ